MPRPTFKIIDLTLTPGWGQQVAEVSVELLGLPRGLVVNRINVFKMPDGRLSFGPPLLPIETSGGRYSGFSFTNDKDRLAFWNELDRALRREHPKLGDPLPRSGERP
jgi:hypothetical protein